MPPRNEVYEPNMQGLARYLAFRFGIERAVAYDIAKAVFIDFIGPMVMEHGHDFTIHRFATFYRRQTISRWNHLTGKMTVPYYALKMRVSRLSGYARHG